MLMGLIICSSEVIITNCYTYIEGKFIVLVEIFVSGLYICFIKWSKKRNVAAISSTRAKLLG